jgi:hypothetical protein
MGGKQGLKIPTLKTKPNYPSKKNLPDTIFDKLPFLFPNTWL